MSKAIPNEMIERAVELWCRKLKAPSFDNGTEGEKNGDFMTLLATANIESAKNSVTDLDARIEVFRASLTKALITLRDSDKYFASYLSVDYGPSPLLASAADEAGIPDQLFSVKSTVYFSEKDVSTTFGYSAPRVYHYPLPNGDWLITTLAGNDMDKVIAQVMAGNAMGLTVENKKDQEGNEN